MTVNRVSTGLIMQVVSEAMNPAVFGAQCRIEYISSTDADGADDFAFERSRVAFPAFALDSERIGQP